MSEPKAADAMKPMQIWPFRAAPEAYRALSEHGGDEDWVVFIPDDCDSVPWCFDFDPEGEDQYVSPWGHGRVYRVEGGRVLIFAHA